MSVYPPHVLQHFRADISKDEHFRGRDERSGCHIFVKQVRDEDSGRREFEALSLLAAVPGEVLVPRPLDLRQGELHLELVEGIRLYDLLRLLGQLANGEPELTRTANDVATLLLARARGRIELMQAHLADAADILSTGPYPCEIKVEGMFALLSQLLGLSPLGSKARAELAAFKTRWDTWASVPFRDATPKNIIVAVEALAIGRHPGAAARRDALARLMTRVGMDFWRTVPLFDIDFTSVEHRTAPEDDLVSLLAHEASFRALSPAGGGADIPSAGGLRTTLQRNPERAASALFVRYLRFAGRKVAYRLVNPVGGATRFRHDHFSFYFDMMPRFVSGLHPALLQTMPATLARWSAIAAAAAPYDAVDDARRDAYHAFIGRPAHYWQESPLELAMSGERATAK